MPKHFFKSDRQRIGVAIGPGISREGEDCLIVRENGEALSAADRSRAGACYAALPSRLCIVRELRPPPLRRSRLEKVLDGMLDTELPFPVEECITLHSDPEFDAHGKPVVLSVAARRTDIRKELQTLAERGLDPAALLPEPLVYWHDSLGLRPPASREEPRWIVVRREATQTVLRGRGARLRQCAVGRADDATLAERTRPPEPPSPPLPPVVFLCGFSRESAEALVRRNFPDLAPEAPRFLPDGHRWLAAALARANRDGFAKRWNFRIEEFMRPADRKTLETAPGKTAAGIAAAALLLGGTARFAESRARGLAEAAWKDFGDRASALAGYPVNRRDAGVLETLRSAMDERMSADISRFVAPPPTATLVPLLEDAAACSVALHRIDFADGEWVARGTSPDPDRADELVRRLEARGMNVRRADENSGVASPFTLVIAP